VVDGPNDLLRYAQESPRVGEAAGDDLVSAARIEPAAATTYVRKIRSRPNNGRKKRTDRHPLDEPPWEMLRALGIYLPPNLDCLAYTPINWRSGPDYLRWKKQVFQMWGHHCHLCGHGDAHTADHLIPLSVWSNQPYEPHLSRPAHGVEGCPTCHVPCNSSRGNKRLAVELNNYTPPVAL